MIYPIVLCGGRGTRLWPKSRADMPKQFISIMGNESPFQSSCKRVRGGLFRNLTIFTSEEYRFLAAQQLNDIGNKSANIFLEPEPKNTGPSVVAACQYLFGKDKGAVVIVLPSDHFIPSEEIFLKAVNEGLNLAKEGRIVTFGIKPTRAETGYGYIEIKKGKEVSAFLEKPNSVDAKKMYDSGKFLWNSGMFMMKAEVLLEAAAEYAPDINKITSTSLNEAETDIDFKRISKEPWSTLRNISIDKAIMEQVSNLNCIPFVGEWSDLGDWNSIKRLRRVTDEDGNTVLGKVTHVNLKNSIVETTEDGPTLGVIGLENVVIVADRDAVLVADVEKSQMVGVLIEKMRDQGLEQATKHSREYRPWGWFEILQDDKSYKVKRLFVYPNAQLSLQSHRYRSEHWVVVYGTATTLVGDIQSQLTTGKSIFINAGTKHRLMNRTLEPLVVVEVQTGDYFGEDDIIRYEDVYMRT